MKKKVYNLGIVLLASLLVIFPFYNILIKVYNWHIKQIQFWQGGLEVLIFIIVTYVLSIKYKNKNLSIVLFFGSVYLSLNGVIIPFILAYIFFEIIFYIGNTFIFDAKLYKGGVNTGFISGISIWGSFAIICSLLGHGKINDLRIMTLVLLLLSILLNKRNSNRTLYSYFSSFIKNSYDDKSVLFLRYFLIFFVLCLVAKTNSAQDYDSLWYGLRPEYVLVKDSFYDYLGYSSFVYYYPKLVELLFLPLSGLNDYSFIITGNIFVLILFIIEFYNTVRIQYKLTEKFNLLFTILVFSIPAIANISVTAKPDIMGAFFTFCVFSNFILFLKTNCLNNLIFSILSLALLTGTKETYLLWGGILFICICIILVFYCRKRKLLSHKILKIRNINKNCIIILGLGIFFVLGVHYRTLKLTGYPLYPILIDFFNKLGFKSVYPAKEVSSNMFKNFSDILNLNYIFERLYQFIFNPGKLGKVIMLWTSNLLVLLSIISLTIFKRELKKDNIVNNFMNISLVTFFIFLIIFILLIPDPDGNYYILPIIVITFILFGKIVDSNWFFTSKSIITLVFTMFIFLHIPIMFVSHPSWAVGTKGFDFQIIKSNFETSEKNKNANKYNGYFQIAEYLSNNYKEKRIISSHSGYTRIGRLDTGLETFYEISSGHFSNPNTVNSYENFVKYIKHAKIEGFLLLKEDESLFKTYVEEYISQNKVIKEIVDEKAIFYAISLY